MHKSHILKEKESEKPFTHNTPFMSQINVRLLLEGGAFWGLGELLVLG